MSQTYPFRPTQVVINKDGRWVAPGSSVVPTNAASANLSRGKNGEDSVQWRDEAGYVMFRIDNAGVPHFPGDGLPTPTAATIYGVPGYNPPNVILLQLERQSDGTVIGWVTANPNAYGGSLNLPAL
jgi:hypothetical protein